MLQNRCVRKRSCRADVISEKAKKIADAVLYEGYILYPYRKSAIKNVHRFNFGLIGPGEHFKTEVIAHDASGFRATVRFLQIQRRQLIDNSGSEFERLEIEGVVYESWDEAVERETGAGVFEFPAEIRAEMLPHGAEYKRTTEHCRGEVTIDRSQVSDSVSKYSVTIRNDGPATMISAHAVLTVGSGEFVSLLEFPPDLASEIGSLENNGLFPVLIDRRTMLASPIIMYDFPEVANESAADFYDLTEIDELLALRIRTMTDEEKSEARRLDPRAATVIDEAERLSLGSLHGAYRVPDLKPGTRVRLHPKQNADAFDLFLDGRTAMVEREEIDLEGRKCYSVILEDELEIVNAMEKNVGHRFFFRADELETTE